MSDIVKRARETLDGVTPGMVRDLCGEVERLEELVESQEDQWRELYDRHRQACIDRDAAMRRAASAEDRLEDAELAAYWMEKYDDAMETWREAEASADRKREIIRRVRAVVNPAGGTPGVIRQVRADDIRRALDGDA